MTLKGFPIRRSAHLFWTRQIGSRFLCREVMMNKLFLKQQKLTGKFIRAFGTHPSPFVSVKVIVLLSWVSFLPRLVCRKFRMHKQDPRSGLCDLNRSIHTSGFRLAVVQHWMTRSQLLWSNLPHKHPGTWSQFSWIRDPQVFGRQLSFWAPKFEGSFLWIS